MNSPTHNGKRQIFEQHFLFGKLSTDEIEPLIGYTQVEQHPAGRKIFDKGSRAQSVIAVLRGSIKISSLSSDGKEVLLRIINRGEIFGEIGVLDGEERSAHAAAMTDCELLVLNRGDFLRMLKNRADLCIIMLRILCRRLRQTSEQVEDVVFRHLESRVAKALLQLAESVGLHGLQSKSVKLHVSQMGLGNVVGGSRESINKILQNWHHQGLIDRRKTSILIHDIDALSRLICLAMSLPLPPKVGSGSKLLVPGRGREGQQSVTNLPILRRSTNAEDCPFSAAGRRQPGWMTPFAGVAAVHDCARDRAVADQTMRVYAFTRFFPTLGWPAPWRGICAPD